MRDAEGVSRNPRTRHYASIAVFGCLALGLLGWNLTRAPDVCVPGQLGDTGHGAAGHVAGRIVMAESGGDADAKNRYSSATGAGQFVDGTWLELIRRYRTDLRARTDAELLALRRDPDLSRDMVRYYAERNAATLRSHCLPVTPGTLYLSHFAGGAGAVAVLSAPNDADAATVMADADARGFITRSKIVAANPFLSAFTVADLKAWADRKMAVR